jgi:hypothetical protein
MLTQARHIGSSQLQSSKLIFLTGFTEGAKSWLSPLGNQSHPLHQNPGENTITQPPSSRNYEGS